MRESLFPVYTLSQHARELSSGTIASLSGLRKYSEIDELRERFVKFCKEINQSWTWGEAWKLFVEEGNL